MNATADPGLFEERHEPGLASSVALAVAVHVLLALVLLFGVRWQSKPPESVAVELWIPPPPPVLEKVEPPRPQPQVEPAPPPKPPPVVKEPDIAEKAPPKPKPKPEPLKKDEPRPEPPKKPEPKAKPEPVKPPPQVRDDPVKRRMEEELRREQLALNMDREKRLIEDQLKRESGARELAGWMEKIQGKIRANVVLPPDLKGNPEAVYDVVQLPTGEILSVKLRRTSGHAAYDQALERAILKSSPLPRPDRPELFQRDLTLRFRPLN